MRGTTQRWRRVAAGALAFSVGDLIVGLAAFSCIVLGTFWFFSIGWIQLHAEFLSRGHIFGSEWQLYLAWVTVVIALPLLGCTMFLASRALALPRQVYRRAQGELRHAPGAIPTRRGVPRTKPAADSRSTFVAGFWIGDL
jgi:hypothetical protein